MLVTLGITFLSFQASQKVIHMTSSLLGITWHFIHSLSTTRPQSCPHKQPVKMKLSRKTKKVTNIIPKLSTLSTQANDIRESYPHYPQFIHKVIHKVIHTNGRWRRSSAVRPAAATQRLNILWSNASYPQFMGLIHKVIHILWIKAVEILAHWWRKQHLVAVSSPASNSVHLLYSP